MGKKGSRGLLLTLVLAIALAPGAAFAADEVHGISLGSDRHGNADSIFQAMKGMPDTVEYVSIVGDMVGDGGGDAPEFYSSKILGEILDVEFPKIVFDEDDPDEAETASEAQDEGKVTASDVTSIVWADHDGSVQDDAKIVFGMDGEGSGLMKTGYNQDGTVAYYIYGIAFYDMKKQENAETAAAEFKSWVDTAELGVPVIVLCHMPLHYARGDNAGAVAWSKALNYAATSYETDAAGKAVVRNVIYSFGHNHTTESSTGKYSGEFYIPCGSNMEIGASKDVWSTIYYTYTTAGYLNQNTAATLISIDASAIMVEKYQEGEVTDGLYDTESKKSGKFASEFVTSGSNRIAHVRTVTTTLPEGCSMTYTDMLGGELTVESGTSTMYLLPGKMTATVTFPTDEYAADTLTVTRNERNLNVASLGGNSFSFTMPRSDIEVNLAIKPRIAIDSAEVTGIEEAYTFTGGKIVPKLAVTLDGETLKSGKAYKVTYSDNVNAGTATLTIEGIGDYRGSIQKTFQILPASIADLSVADIGPMTFTGKPISPDPEIQFNGTALVPGVDFDVQYSDNVNVNGGPATVTIVGKGNFTGQLTTSFQIAKAANTLVAKGKTITVKRANLKKKSKVIAKNKAFKVSKAQGKVTYAKTNKAGGAKIVVNKKTGKITLKKGLGKGLYKVKVKVTAAGNANYQKLAKNVTVKVKVK